MVVFDVIFVETIGFDSKLHAFEVRSQVPGLVPVTPDITTTTFIYTFFYY